MNEIRIPLPGMQFKTESEGYWQYTVDEVDFEADQLALCEIQGDRMWTVTRYQGEEDGGWRRVRRVRRFFMYPLD